MTNEREIPDARDPGVNPLVEIVLRFRDDSGLRYRLEKPASQAETFKALGKMAAALDFHPGSAPADILVGDEAERVEHLETIVRRALGLVTFAVHEHGKPDPGWEDATEIMELMEAALADERPTV